MSQIEMTKNAEGVFEIKLPEADPVADLHAGGFLDKFASMEFMGLNVGGAAIGVALNAGINALAAKFIPGQTAFLTKPLGKGLLAWGISQYGSKWLGSKSANAIAWVLLIDATRGYIEPMISKLITGGTASLSQTMHGNAYPGTIAEYNALLGIR